MFHHDRLIACSDVEILCDTSKDAFKHLGDVSYAGEKRKSTVIEPACSKSVTGLRMAVCQSIRDGLRLDRSELSDTYV